MKISFQKILFIPLLLLAFFTFIVSTAFSIFPENFSFSLALFLITNQWRN